MIYVYDSLVTVNQHGIRATKTLFTVHISSIYSYGTKMSRPYCNILKFLKEGDENFVHFIVHCQLCKNSGSAVNKIRLEKEKITALSFKIIFIFSRMTLHP